MSMIKDYLTDVSESMGLDGIIDDSVVTEGERRIKEKQLALRRTPTDKTQHQIWIREFDANNMRPLDRWYVSDFCEAVEDAVGIIEKKAKQFTDATQAVAKVSPVIQSRIKAYLADFWRIVEVRAYLPLPPETEQ